MLKYIYSRLCSSIVVVFGVSTMVFLLIHIVPGDPIEVMLGERAQLADRESLRESLGLHLPLWQQWLEYYKHLFQLDLGYSIHSREDVYQILADRIPATILLALSSLFIAIIIALPLGVIAAVKKGTFWDTGTMVFSVLGVSIPNFWMGPLLIMLFSLWLGWFPVSGKEGISSLVLPTITLGTALSALLSRMVRASLLEVLSEEYIKAARARGLNSSIVIWRHALLNASLPIITVLGMQFGTLLAGAVITETIFSWPGIGQLTIESIQKRDYPVLQACILLISITYVCVNLMTDILYTYIDPRIRLES